MLQLGSFYAAQTPGHTIELQMSFCYFHVCMCLVGKGGGLQSPLLVVS